MALASAVSPRIGVVGAGIGGLALAGILSRKLPKARLSVFERANKNRDEGYGLDLDEWGQEALVRAGVFHKFWSISRRHSDVWRTWALDGEHVLFTKWSNSVNVESNRAGIRSLFLDALAERGHPVRYGSPIAGLRQEQGRSIALLGPNNDVEGQFDVVIDASGLHSKLRQLRVVDDAGCHFSGMTMIHGVIENPEATAPRELLERLTEGTCAVVGQGHAMILQRFGAATEDRRTALLYFPAMRDADGEIEAEMGLAKASGREAAIRREGSEDLARIKRWVHQDMGDHFAPVWHSAIDNLSRATVRGEQTHGENSRLRGDEQSAQLPFACCGDSLRNIGLGGGGNLALQDALGYAKALSRRGAFDQETGSLTEAGLAELRGEESKALVRKKRHFSFTSRWRPSLALR